MAEKKRKVLTVDKSEKPEKVKFVVKSGQTFGVGRLGAGEEVELTVAEALPFGDKLEPADRNTVLPSAATQEELAELGVIQVANPSPASTDRTIMTAKQRAETSQTDLKTGGPEPTAEPPSGTHKKVAEKSEKSK